MIAWEVWCLIGVFLVIVLIAVLPPKVHETTVTLYSSLGRKTVLLCRGEHPTEWVCREVPRAK